MTAIVATPEEAAGLEPAPLLVRPPLEAFRFDWELATIGDPLTDGGYLVATWAEPDDPEDVFFDRLKTGVPAIAERAWRIAAG